MGQTCHLELLINFFVKVAEKEVARAKAEEEAQEKRKQANDDRKAAKKVEQKKAKMEMKKRKVSYQHVQGWTGLKSQENRPQESPLRKVRLQNLVYKSLFCLIFGNRFQTFAL